MVPLISILPAPVLHQTKLLLTTNLTNLAQALELALTDPNALISALASRIPAGRPPRPLLLLLLLLHTAPIVSPKLTRFSIRICMGAIRLLVVLVAPRICIASLLTLIVVLTSHPIRILS